MLQRFENWTAPLALRITNAVSTMACAVLFLMIAFVGFPGFHATAQQYVQWISQTVIQLVMLSIIMVGQRLQSQQQTVQHSEIQAHHARHASEFAALHKKIDALTPPKGGKQTSQRR